MGQFITWDEPDVKNLDPSIFLSDPINQQTLFDDARDAGIPIWVESKSLGDEQDAIILSDYGLVSDIRDVGNSFSILIKPHAQTLNLDKNELNSSVLDTLREALTNNTIILFAERDDNKIVDAALVFNREDLFDFKEVSTAETTATLDPKVAVGFFNEIVNKSCRLGSSEQHCIPFLYPEDGCWARAHAMFRHLKNKGYTSQKIWTYKSLFVDTRNTPKCRVNWGYHVAVLVEIEGQGKIVFDPSLFDQPCTIDQWLKIQNGRQRHTFISKGNVFYRTYSGRSTFDKNFTNTERLITRYKLKLISRGKSNGWPPYSHC